MFVESDSDEQGDIYLQKAVLEAESTYITMCSAISLLFCKKKFNLKISTIERKKRQRAWYSGSSWNWPNNLNPNYPSCIKRNSIDFCGTNYVAGLGLYTCKVSLCRNTKHCGSPKSYETLPSVWHIQDYFVLLLYSSKSLLLHVRRAT